MSLILFFKGLKHAMMIKINKSAKVLKNRMLTWYVTYILLDQSIFLKRWNTVCLKYLYISLKVLACSTEHPYKNTMPLKNQKGIHKL